MSAMLSAVVFAHISRELYLIVPLSVLHYESNFFVPCCCTFYKNNLITCSTSSKFGSIVAGLSIWAQWLLGL